MFDANAFARTRAAYDDPAGAAAYAARVAATAAERDASARSMAPDADPRGLRVVDMGCGLGGDVAWWRSRGALAWGVDASPSMLARARAAHGGEDWWIRADMLGDVPLPVEGGLDVVWSMQSLVHVPREATPALLSRWAGWLRPGGRLVLATKAGEGEAMSGALGAGLPRVMVFRSLAEIAGIVEAAGLRVEEAYVRPSVERGSGESLACLRARLDSRV